MMRNLIIFGLCFLILAASAIDIPSKIEQDFQKIDQGVTVDRQEGIMGKAARVVRDAAEGIADTLTAGDIAAKEALIKNTPARTKPEKQEV